jgi:site-specific recombinase XerD
MENVPETARNATHDVPLSYALSQWLLDRQCAGVSPRTLEDYRATATKFTWWLTHEAGRPDALAALTPENVRLFLAYCRDAHPTGRWGRDHPESRRAAPQTALHQHRNLGVATKWLVREELLTCDPMPRVTAPRVPTEQREPLSPDEVRKLFTGARASCHASRDEAVCLLLLDTGMRASELCGLTVGDALCADGAASVRGKAQKMRRVFWSADTARALRRYLRRRDSIDPAAPLFVTQRGRPFGRANVHEVVSDAGDRGRMGRQVYPHLLRHTAALAMLRHGATLFEVQRILGHANLSVLRGYVRETVDDLRAAHRLASPVTNLLGSGRRVAVGGEAR